MLPFCLDFCQSKRVPSFYGTQGARQAEHAKLQHFVSIYSNLQHLHLSGQSPKVGNLQHSNTATNDLTVAASRPHRHEGISNPTPPAILTITIVVSAHRNHTLLGGPSRSSFAASYGPFLPQIRRLIIIIIILFLLTAALFLLLYL